MKKKLLSIILAIAMVACMISTVAFTASAAGEPDYLYIKNIGESSATFEIIARGSYDSGSPIVSYRVGADGNWVNIGGVPEDGLDGWVDLTLAPGQCVYLKSDFGTSEYWEYWNSCNLRLMNFDDGNFAAGGDVTTLINGVGNVLDLSVYGRVGLLRGLFSQLGNKLTDISDLKLPSTKLAGNCYQSMFENSGLTTVPANLLPATELAEGCYEYVFMGSSNLTNAPDLPANELVTSCYSSMFSGCSKLSSLRVNFSEWGNGSNWTTGGFIPGGLEDDVTLDFYCPKALADGIDSAYYYYAMADAVKSKTTFHTPERTIVTKETDEKGKEVYTDHFVYGVGNGEDNYKIGVMGRQEKLDDSGVGRLVFKLSSSDLNKLAEQQYLVVTYNDGKGHMGNVKLDCAYTWFYDIEDGEPVQIKAEDCDCAAFAIVDADTIGINDFEAYGYYRLYAGTCTDEDNILYAAGMDKEN